MSTPMLDHDMLVALEERWRAHNVPLVKNLRPGLTAEGSSGISATSA